MRREYQNFFVKVPLKTACRSIMRSEMKKGEQPKMANHELIKDFDLIRDSLRQFYVYGYKTRSEYDAKSSRTYDNECRLMANWLDDYMSFRQTKAGRSRFITIDSA